MVAWAEERIFRQSPNVFLCVSSFNAARSGSISGLGYERVGELPDFLTTGHSEIVSAQDRGPWLTFKAS